MNRKNVAFRLPDDLRETIREEAPNQSLFLLAAADHLIAAIEDRTPAAELLLPAGVNLLALPARMASIRATDAELIPYRDMARRLYQHTTRFMLWAAALRLPLDAQKRLCRPQHPISTRHAGTIQIPRSVAEILWPTSLAEEHEPDAWVERACQGFLRAVNQGVALSNLLLPPDSLEPITTTRNIPTEETRPWRVHFQNLEVLYETIALAPRLYHSTTTLILWAALHAAKIT